MLAKMVLAIAGSPGWWILLCLIPLVQIVIAALVGIAIARAFGQSVAFGLVLWFGLSGIGYMVLDLVTGAARGGCR